MSVANAELRPDRKVVIADCKLGNMGSVANMVKHVGGTPIISQDADVILDSTHLILPGVGNFEYGMKQLHRLGFLDVLNAAREKGTHILGICLGMALMTKWSDEGNCDGLGWFDFRTIRFPNHLESGDRLLVPHMGWNQIEPTPEALEFAAVPTPSRFYFVHSYYVDGAGKDDCRATSVYGDTKFASAIGRDNVIGVQFHPEKSHKFGMAFMRDFLAR